MEGYDTSWVGPLTCINSQGVPTSDCAVNNCYISQLTVTVGFIVEGSGLLGFDTVSGRVVPSIVKGHSAFIIRDLTGEEEMPEPEDKSTVMLQKVVYPMIQHHVLGQLTSW